MGEELYELPKGWVWVTLDSLCTAIGDVDHKMPKAQETGIPYISTRDFLENGTINFENTKKISEEDYKKLCRKIYPEKGDILLSRYGTVGEVILVKTDNIFQASYSVAIIKPVLYQINNFIATALKSEIVQTQIRKYIRGVAQPDLGLGHIRELYLPFPSLTEQYRILEKIEELFTQLDAGVELLKKVKAKLKRYRQAVLKAAVEGNLTKEWRTAHQGELEPASVLLDRILKQRREKWEAEQLAKMQAQGKTPKDDSWKLKYKEPIAPDTSDLPELPDGWCWLSIEQISYLVTDGDHNPPKSSERVPSGIPHLTAKNINNWKLSEEGCTYITPQDFERIRKRYEPQGGDVIITCVGTLGRTAIVPDNYIFSADRNLAIVRLIENGLLQSFLLFNLNTNEAQKNIHNASGSTAQPHFYLADIRAFRVTLAPVAEQNKITEEVELTFSVIDQLEKTIDTNLKRAEKLRQTILKQAFEGKLVPQDPNDEPAEKLLERIKAEKAARELEKKSSRQPKIKSTQPYKSKKSSTQLELNLNNQNG